MFEASLMESQGTLAWSSQRVTRQRLVLLSVALQSGLAALIMAVPLLHPERLPFHIDAPRVLPVLSHLPKPIPAVATMAAASSAPSLPSEGRVMTAPPIIPIDILSGPDTGEPPVAMIGFGSGMGSSTVPVGIGEPAGRGVSVVPMKPAPERPLHVSSGVSAGLLIAPIRPLYPKIAMVARVEGAVVVEAVISKTGQIESAHVVSGPAMLQGAALEAVLAARYSPYALNGQPTAVETTITINFRLGS